MVTSRTPCLAVKVPMHVINLVTLHSTHAFSADRRRPLPSAVPRLDATGMRGAANKGDPDASSGGGRIEDQGTLVNGRLEQKLMGLFARWRYWYFQCCHMKYLLKYVQGTVFVSSHELNPQKFCAFEILIFFSQ